ncbi:MAG: CotH kinase family protein, partial [Firmicutes bacterium]|nr:CotH kinase family protein [Bacillota bacterium]
PKDPVNPGYVLVGWYLDLAGDAYKFSTFPASDITLKAKWTLGSVISFDTGIAGLKVPDLVQIPGASISAPSAPPYAGHILEGWYNGATHYVFNVMPSSNLTLTAKWAVSSKLPAISVTLQEASGVPIPSADPRFRTKEYLPCVYTVAGGATGEKMQSVTGLIRAKGNGSFRENPEQRRPYRIKLDKKQSLFGWPKSKQYTLVSASHNSSDDSRLVAYSAFELARDVLALEYAVRSQPIDLFINGVYRGVYLFTETVKVEEGRLEIESEPAGIHAGTSADPYLTDTGYLLYYGNGAHTGYGTPTFARFTLQGGGNGFYIKSPDEDDVADAEIPASTRKGYDAQLAFIRAETQKLVDYMEAGNFSGFSGISDVASWVDGYIIQELYGNTDVHNGGFYLYKKSAEQGGKWYAGPPWDMDATVRSATSGIKVGNNNNRFLVAMYKMPAYMALVKARWKEISPQIKTCLTAKFNFFINDSGYQSAFIRGAGAGDTTATQSGNWKSNAEDKRDWLLSRCNWLDGEWG